MGRPGRNECRGERAAQEQMSHDNTGQVEQEAPPSLRFLTSTWRSAYSKRCTGFARAILPRRCAIFLLAFSAVRRWNNPLCKVAAEKRERERECVCVCVCVRACETKQPYTSTSTERHSWSTPTPQHAEIETDFACLRVWERITTSSGCVFHASFYHDV